MFAPGNEDAPMGVQSSRHTFLARPASECVCVCGYLHSSDIHALRHLHRASAYSMRDEGIAEHLNNA